MYLCIVSLLVPSFMDPSCASCLLCWCCNPCADTTAVSTQNIHFSYLFTYKQRKNLGHCSNHSMNLAANKQKLGNRLAVYSIYSRMIMCTLPHSNILYCTTGHYCFIFYFSSKSRGTYRGLPQLALVWAHHGATLRTASRGRATTACTCLGAPWGCPQDS